MDNNEQWSQPDIGQLHCDDFN